MKSSTISSQKINETPVTCGEPARRTDSINTYRTNNMAWEGVWDQNHIMKSRNVVRFDLRDLGIVGVSESRVGESEVLSTLEHGIGIESDNEFPSIIGAKLLSKSSMKIDNNVAEQLRSDSLMTGSLVLHDKSIVVQ